MSSKEDSSASSGSVERRGFLKWLSRAFLSLWAFGFVGVVISYLRTPSSSRSRFSNVIRAGNADSLSTGQARLVRYGSEPIYVIRLVNGELVALSALCTHYRCALNWNGETKTLVCPCHNGVFDSTGRVLSGLPTRALPSFRVEERLGEILVYPSGRV